jgi:hypothetical protein
VLAAGQTLPPLVVVAVVVVVLAPALALLVQPVRAMRGAMAMILTLLAAVGLVLRVPTLAQALRAPGALVWLTQSLVPMFITVVVVVAWAPVQVAFKDLGVAAMEHQVLLQKAIPLMAPPILVVEAAVQTIAAVR